MWIVRPQSVTHCQRRLAAKFQFVALPTDTDMHNINYQRREILWNLVKNCGWLGSRPT